MRNFKRIITALLLTLSLAVSALFFMLHTEVGAVGTTLVYSTESNSGTRHVICTTLDGTGAEEYYSGEYTYDKLEELSPSELYDALRTLMTDTHTKMASYDDCRDMACLTDCENNDGRVNLIYSSKSVTQGDCRVGNGWSREHIWQMLLGKETTGDVGSDLHHLRPCDNRLNTVRSNRKYGNVTNGIAATGTELIGSSFIGGYYNDGYFEPLDNAKGDVARICLYVYVRWGAYWGADDITKAFESIDVLLSWCESDPVDTWEIGRNEVVSAYQGNRNVFIDYPELAFLLFGREIPSSMTTPSGIALSGDPSCAHAFTEIRNKSDGSCTEDGYTGDTYCKDCGKKLLTGDPVTAVGEHTFDNSCDSECNLCDYVRPVTHSFKDGHENDEAQHWLVCSLCGASEERSDHVYYHACDTDCNICAYVRVISHSFMAEWSSDENEHWHSCSVCGIFDEKSSHEYSDDKDKSCNVCAHVRQVPTEPSSTVKPSDAVSSTTADSTSPESTSTADSTSPKSTSTADSTSPKSTSTADSSTTGGENTTSNSYHRNDNGVRAFLFENVFFIIFVLAVLCGVVAVISKRRD